MNRTASEEELKFDGLVRWEPATRTIILTEKGSAPVVISFGHGDGATGDFAFTAFQEFITKDCRAAQSEIVFPFLTEIFNCSTALQSVT